MSAEAQPDGHGDGVIRAHRDFEIKMYADSATPLRLRHHNGRVVMMRKGAPLPVIGHRGRLDGVPGELLAMDGWMIRDDPFAPCPMCAWETERGHVGQLPAADQPLGLCADHTMQVQRLWFDQLRGSDGASRLEFAHFCVGGHERGQPCICKCGAVGCAFVERMAG